MKEVTFSKSWRGHTKGDVVSLTDARAAELQSAGYLTKAQGKPKEQGLPQGKPKA